MKQKLTVKEEEVMNILWENGDMFIRDIVARMPDPKPNYNTVATQVRFLEEKGFVVRRPMANSYLYSVAVGEREYRGQAVGEMVVDRDGRDLAALLCGRVEDVQIREGESPLDFTLWGYGGDGMPQPLPRQDLLLFTPYNPEADSPYGVSMLRSMPFLTELLGKIYSAMGANWERMGNVRFAVVCKPQNGEMDPATAQERSRQIAREWSRAMQSSKSGSVRDFVAIGDVDIRVIGADNQILDSEVPVRQILEQLIAKTGIPPFMLGLSWSSTERMSTQQADILTSELTAIRRGLTPVVEKICRMWMRLQGLYEDFEVVWDDINLQDELDEAKAEWYRQQARKLELENLQLEGKL